MQPGLPRSAQSRFLGQAGTGQVDASPAGTFGSLGVCLFVATSFVVGGRLLLLARRTRRLPELAMGIGLLLLGGSD